ncbi:unannotated protein [freshwater metagenome]|uniref:Unannotated protein n=1 Tax=freshwater metagenome TaxID=449393 RepID=A0A6J7HBL3_9ZZZZ
MIAIVPPPAAASSDELQPARPVSPSAITAAAAITLYLRSITYLFPRVLVFPCVVRWIMKRFSVSVGAPIFVVFLLLQPQQ